MPRRRAFALTLLLCLSALDFSACVVRRRIITRKGAKAAPVLLTTDKQALIERIQREFNTIHDFSATVDMVPALGSSEKNKITEYKDVRGYILFRKPADIRIVGLYPVVRNKAFDMVSNGAKFELYLPAKNRFITGSNELAARSANKIENLRPQHFLEALLVQPVQPSEKVVFENFTDEDNAVYILHLVSEEHNELIATRSIWFSRLNLRLARQLIFDPAGNILTDARYNDWQNYDGVPFPKQIEIDRPQDEYAVVLTVVKMDINRGVTEDKFVLQQPEGSQLQVLGQEPGSSPPPAKGTEK